MELENNYPESGKANSVRQPRHVLTHKWILDLKQRITRLQSTTPEKLGNKEDPKRETHGGAKEW